MRLNLFQVKAIQVEHGDALLISYGDVNAPRHLLVDGGPASTKDNLLKVLDHCRVEGRLQLEALVITHYDLDHIEGIIGLLKEKPDWLEISDIWFNGYLHLPSDRLGSREGDTLSELIKLGKYAWNHAFDGDSILQDRAPVSLAGGAKVFVLSPSVTTLKSLAKVWTDPSDAPDKSGIPSDLLGRADTWPPGSYSEVSEDAFRRDPSPANGSSIALLIEFDERRVLLAGDAFAHVVSSGLKKHFQNAPKIHLVKVSHHGSKANTDQDLLRALNCRRYLISTNGAIHKHPDNALIARLLLISGKPDIIFNYDVAHTARWRQQLPGWPIFKAIYPSADKLFVSVDV